MRKLLMVAVLVTLVVTGCQDNKKEAPALVRLEQTDSLQKIITQKDNEMNDLMGTLNEIETGFREINEAENRVELVKDGEGANRSQQLRENVQFISNRMKQNRALIAKLRQQLRESSFKGDEFKKTIENLVTQMNVKDKQL